ncbi:PhzF family phenazine biosynthesis protein [Nocardia sp. CA-107356]|uniref:PhzF family phenazine biosynthesis protein n=1 Tax=Nocardia sp. CA-107356 TaxID=3239972 RepID=UPI003D930FA3
MNTEVLRYTAFSTDPAGGNPAGVVLDGTGLDDSEMQRIAEKVGYSETAFLNHTHDRHYRVRYFSPLAEVDFCGHATVATAVALTERIGPGALNFRTNIGDIVVETSTADDRPTATLTSVATHSRAATATEIYDTLAALGWDPTDLDPAFPTRVAYAGNDHLMLAAASRERLAALDYDFDALGTIMREAGWTTVHLFHREDDRHFQARNPFPIGGVVEDAATGAAAAAFGGYLRDIGHADSGRIIITQGVDMGRPSQLLVDLDPAATGIRVTGNAVRID